MNLKEIVKVLDLCVFSGEQGLEKSVSGGYSSDLLSDVMGNAKENQIWITLQTHKNIMAIASLKDLAAIVLVKGLQPDSDTMEFSKKENIPILGTAKETFDISGELYNLINT